MSESSTPGAAAGAAAGAAFAGHKLVLFGLPIVATLIAWWLGMRFAPPRPGREAADMLNRLLACAVSAFVLGLPALLALHNYLPWVFGSGAALAALAGLPIMLGFFAVAGCVMLLCSLPGPWLVVATVTWFERRKDKDIGELVHDAADDVRDVVKGGPPP